MIATPPKNKSVVLFSAGLDSTVNLYKALTVSDIVLALTFDYGQRAAKPEIERARQHCERLGVAHRVIELPWFKHFTKTSLVSREAEVPTMVKIESLSESQVSASRVWVPNRNGILLGIAAGFAEGLGAKWVIPGFNREEAATFPDNSADFLAATSQGLSFSTANQVEAHCFTTQMDKREIVKMGRELGVTFELVWPCYFGGEQPCRTCESCLRYQRALL